MSTWSIGAVTVTRIEESLGYASFPPEQYFVGFERETLERHAGWLVPEHYLPEKNALITSVHSWLIRTPQRTILLDCCAGNHKERVELPRFHRLDTPFLERLRAAGAGPQDIDIVLCTHLHSDHIGWNTMLHDGRWLPTFPNARYLFSRAENDSRDPRDVAYRDSVLPVLEAGRAELIEGAHAIDDLLRVEPAPGHTPGHVVLKLASAGGRAVFSGDVMHHPIQIYAPHWNSRFCELPEQARTTRRRVLEHCAETGALVFPTHFGAPHVAAIAARAGEFSARFVSACA